MGPGPQITIRHHMKLCRECFRLCDLFELRQKFAMVQGQVFRDPIIGHDIYSLDNPCLIRLSRNGAVFNICNV